MLESLVNIVFYPKGVFVWLGFFNIVQNYFGRFVGLQGTGRLKIRQHLGKYF